ncbi:uncharacterized protein PAC_06381 [Phialocephala subalpina]|uniref:Uncharacterized protein n=1 Tax=Phialocephala subalpina TaxID=576137 RepID=A0A1L7WUU0_9HELO|nr:uncharacterized protein PAC_06381 [Phialocephala subalpina]
MESAHSIRERSKTCRDQFEAYLGLPTIPHRNETLADEQKVRFNLWAANIGVFAKNRASLDYRLRHVPEVRTMALRMLGVLQRNLQRAIQIDELLSEPQALPSSTSLVGPSEGFVLRESSPNPAPSSVETPSTESLQAVAGTISQLQRLSNAIRESSVQSRYSKASKFIIRDEDGNDTTSMFRQFALDLVRSKHRGASEALCERLAESILLRRRRFLYSAKHQETLSHDAQSGQASTDVPSTAASVSVATTRMLPPSQVGSQTINRKNSTPAESLNQSQTTASIFDPSTFRLGIDASEGSTTSTQSSFGVVNKGEYPPAPMIDQGKNECACPYCFETLPRLIVEDKKRWRCNSLSILHTIGALAKILVRRHVRKDLDLYVCVFESCKQPVELFSSVKDWLKHMQWEHGLQWHCMDKAHEILVFPTAKDFENHLVGTHPEAFTQSEASILSRQRARPRPQLFTICPLCDEIPSGLAGDGDGQENLSGKLERHIKEHLEYLALMSLPLRNDAAGEVSDSASLSNASESRYSQNAEGQDEEPPWPDDAWQHETSKQTEAPMTSLESFNPRPKSPGVQGGAEDDRDSSPQVDPAGSSARPPVTPNRHDRHQQSRPRQNSPRPPRQTVEIDDEEPQTDEAHSTWPPPSFLFAVSELPVNEDRQEGGVPPRFNDNARWIPPIYSNGFGEQSIGYLYRWSNDGQISWAEDCSWSNGNWCSRGVPLTEYRASTMFWCNAWTQFLATRGDPSMRDMADSNQAEGRDRWWPLTFRHNGTLSRIEIAIEEQVIAGTGSWIRRLGLDNYLSRRASDSGGLSGNLAMVIALIAFSCEARDLSKVLLDDTAWEGRRWRGHRRGDGSKSFWHVSEGKIGADQTCTQGSRVEEWWLPSTWIPRIHKARQKKPY